MKEEFKIGIGIVKNTNEDVFLNSFNYWKKFQPQNSWIQIIDNKEGIKSKNLCIVESVKENCEELFIVDDKIYPISKNWYIPYINSNIKHLSLSFNKDNTKDYKDGIHLILNFPDNYLLYFNSKVFNYVDGFDENYHIPGKEHKDLSMKIHRKGITPYPYMDIKSDHTENFNLIL